MSERRACQLVQICRSSYRYQVRGKDDAPIVEALRTISEKHRRYGYRRAHQALVRQTLERINHKRVERLWRENGLTVPRVKRKRRRGKAAPVPLRAERPNHVWTYDFMADSCLSGRKLRFLTVIDEFTRQCLAIEVDYRFPSQKVADCLARLFWKYGTPEYIRSDNGPEFVAKAIRKWLADVEVKTHHIDPGKPWQNAFGESFNGSFRDECLNMEVFHSAREQETGAFKERYKIRSGI
ncbi:MAG: IS3 family transposase, partial [Desulfatibacillaceae bacterium]